MTLDKDVATKPNDLSSIPRTLMAEEQEQMTTNCPLTSIHPQ